MRATERILSLDWAWRVSDGVWWASATTDLDGAPIFGQLHPGRQRRSVDERLCQVCAEPLPRPLWLVPSVWLRDAGGALRDELVSQHAPTCGQCTQQAQRLCPHVRGVSFVIVRAAAVAPWGVIGDVLGRHGVIARARPVRRDDPALGRVLAKQRVISLRGWEAVA
jgi:hypothetical protein